MTDAEDFLAWFELRPEYGVDYAGNLEPIREVTLTLNVPQMTAGGVQLTGSQVCTIRPADGLSDGTPTRILPGTRIVETSDMLTAQALYSRSEYQQITDQPTQKYVKAAKDDTAAHMEAVKARAAAVAAGVDHPADLNDPNPAPLPLTGAVSFAMTADDRLAIDKAIEADLILNDEAFAEWLSKTPIPEVLNAVGDDHLLALRTHVAESERADPRSGLLDALHKILTKAEDFV